MGVVSGELGRAASLLNAADAVIIAASNGFDIADGYDQFARNEAFGRMFGDFQRAYGLTSILQGLASSWPSPEARWSFLARLISFAYGDYVASPVMRAVEGVTHGLPRFVITCNCNGRFERAGFCEDSLFETEGSLARLRCARNCTDEDFDALPFVSFIDAVGEDGCVNPLLISQHAVPRCPRCEAPLDVAVDDSGALASTSRYRAQEQHAVAFMETWREKRVVVMELGVGQRNRAIRAPLVRYALEAPQARYLTFNREEPLLPDGLEDRAVFVKGSLDETLPLLQGAMSQLGGTRGRANAG